MTEHSPISDEYIEWPEVQNVEFDVITNVNDVQSVGEGLDILAATFGRYGIDGFTVQIRDSDNPERSWVLRNGTLFTTEEFIAQFENVMDRERDPLSPEEIEAIEKADAPAERE